MRVPQHCSTASGLMCMIVMSCAQQAAAQSSVVLPKVVSVSGLPALVQQASITGRDGTWSVAYNGSSYWSFNDTWLSSFNLEGRNLVGNSLSWTNNLDASTGIALTYNQLDAAGAPTEFFPFTDGEKAFNVQNCPSQSNCSAEYAIWPGPVVAKPGVPTKEVYHFYFLLKRGSAIDAGKGWDPIGEGIATEELGQGIYRGMATPGSSSDPTLMWHVADGESLYASGGTIEPSGNYLYMLSCNEGCTIGRVPSAFVDVKSMWSYYSGDDVSGVPQWSSSQGAAKQVLGEAGAAGSSMSYVPALSEYLLVYSRPQSNAVVYRVAGNPWGPWSAEQPMFTASQGAGTGVSYAAMSHPEFSGSNGLVQYVSYVRNDGGQFGNLQSIQLVKVVLAAP